MAQLPPGFELESSPSKSVNSQSIPAGFELESSQPQEQRTGQQVDAIQQQRVEALPEFGSGGLLSGEDQTTVAALTPALLTATNPSEIASILKSNVPNVGITYTPEGAIIARNNKTGATVELNKPGISKLDFLQGIGIMAAFTPGGRAATTAGLVAKTGITSTINEAVQALSGGEFNAEQVVIDSATAGLLDKAFEVAKATGRNIKEVLRTDAKVDPDVLLKSFKPQGFKTSFAKEGAQPSQVGATLERATQGDLTEEAIQRLRQAEEQGVQLTGAQASKDFAQAEAEQTLLGGVSKEAQQARAFADQQQEQLLAAADKFTGKFGGSSRLQEATGEIAEVTARDKGEAIQSALKTTQELGRKEVSKLYTEAAETAGEALPLNNDSIVSIADDIIVNRPITAEVEKSINTSLAKFGLIGDSVEQSTRNKFKVMDGDQAITITGDVTPLTLSNAEEFRKSLNKAVGADQTGSVKVIIGELDDQITKVIEQGAETGRTTAFETARAAAAKQAQTFKAKDVIDELVGFKKGTRTPKVDPETVIAKIAKGDKAVTNIRKIKKILLTDPTDQTRNAWNAIKSETVGDILSQAINKDTLEISGVRLNSALKKYKPEALIELLGTKNYNELKQLQKVIGDATIPIPRTTNPSGTFTKFLALSERLGNFAGMGKVNFGSLVKETLSKGQESAGRAKALDKMINTKMKKISKDTPALAKNKGTLRQAARLISLLEIRQLDKESK